MKYYEVCIEQLLPAEQVERRPMLWKFLVELPESTQGPSDESKAMSVAKKAGGTERFSISSPRRSANCISAVSAFVRDKARLLVDIGRPRRSGRLFLADRPPAATSPQRIRRITLLMCSRAR